GPGVSRQTLCGYFPRLTAWLASLALSFNAHCSLNVLQNLAIGAGAVGSLQLTYISKVSIATPKQKPKTPFCFVINALSQRYFLQASDQKDLQDWVEALNRASKITVPKGGSVPPAAEITKPPMVAQAQERKPQMAYKTEIIGGVVVHTPISINQNGGDGGEGSDVATHLLLRRSSCLHRLRSVGPCTVNAGVGQKDRGVRKAAQGPTWVFSLNWHRWLHGVLGTTYCSEC
uniref:Pleckstrin homology domain containing A2 n=1 Tax=Bubo bubo TaxID=30461 RepID=A0A8C0EWU1_BUBBB